MTKHVNDITTLAERALNLITTVTGAAAVAAPTLPTQGVDCRGLTSVIAKVTADQTTGVNCKLTITPWIYGQTRTGTTATEASGWTPLPEVLVDCIVSDPLKQVFEINCQAGDRIYLQVSASVAALTWANIELFAGIRRREVQPVVVQGIVQAITEALEKDKAPDYQLVADVTNGTDGTYDYYITKKRGHLSTAFQFDLDGGSGTVTCTIEATIGTAAPAACTYSDETLTITGAATVTADGMFFNENLLGAATYIHIQVVAATGGANDADWNIQYGSA